VKKGLIQVHKWIGLILIIIGTQVVAADDNEPRVVYVAESKSLWSVALSVKPTEVRVWQAVMALYERNPDAFYDNDVNKLKDNVTLVVPSTEVMLSLTEAEALVRFQLLADQPDKVTLDATSKASVAPKVELTVDESVAAPNLSMPDNTQESIEDKGQNINTVNDQNAVLGLAIASTHLKADGSYFEVSYIKPLAGSSYIRAGATTGSLGSIETNGGNGFQILYGKNIDDTPYSFEIDFTSISENWSHLTTAGNTTTHALSGTVNNKMLFFTGKRTFNKSSSVNPYAGFGLGFSRTNFNLDTNNGLSINSGDTVFAYGYTLGTSISLGDLLTANVGYTQRQIKGGDFMSIQSGTPTPGSTTTTSVDWFSIGIHKNF
jgi:FimV-like protein